VRLIKTLVLPLILACTAVPALERGFSWTYAPAQGDNIRAELAAFPLSKYLEVCQVSRPDVVNEVKSLLADGKYYRKRIVDQKGKGTLLTIYVDSDNILHIVTFRDETCPDCKGTGKRAELFGGAIPTGITRNVAVRFKCLKCNGEGVLKNYTNERFFTLSPEDYEDVESARRYFALRAYSDAPPLTRQWVERLASPNPRERLAACQWLDQNYVRTGMFFQDIMPMLSKARYHETNEKRKMLVWQFWAGKDVPNERKRYYYRIYADAKTGKVARKGFFSEK
jgi:hypothetical protein